MDGAAGFDKPDDFDLQPVTDDVILSVVTSSNLKIMQKIKNKNMYPWMA